MKFFLDSVNLGHIKELNECGLIDGVTTNPSLIAKQGLESVEDIYTYYAEICAAAPADVSLEVIGTDVKSIITEGRKLAKISDKVIVKVPICTAALPAIKKFTSEGIRTNCTLIFSPLQALLAAKAGATFVSPFVGRLDDIHADGINCLTEIKEIFTTYGLSTRILAASLRNKSHLLDAALVGVDAITCPYSLIQATLSHPLTDKGLEIFLSDYHTSMQRAALRTKN